jgi:hypothetical protein
MRLACLMILLSLVAAGPAMGMDPAPTTDERALPIPQAKMMAALVESMAPSPWASLADFARQLLPEPHDLGLPVRPALGEAARPITVLLRALNAGVGWSGAWCTAPLGAYLQLRFSLAGGRQNPAYDQVAEVLRRRLDAFGATGAYLLLRDNGYEIVVPGAAAGQADLLVDRLTQDVALAFQLVSEDGAIARRAMELLPSFIEERPGLARVLRVDSGHRGQRVVADDEGAMEAYVEWLTPRISMVPSFAIGGERHGYAEPPKTLYHLYVLDGEPVLTHADVAAATVGYNDWGEPYVMLTFTEGGGKRFGEVTGASVDRMLAIVLDGKVVSAPVIRERIDGGRAQITLGSGAPLDELQEQAAELASRLSAGAMRTPVTLESSRIVPATRPSHLARRSICALALLPVAPGAGATLFLGVSGESTSGSDAQ